MALVRISQVRDAPPGPRLPAWLRASRTNYQALHDLKVELRERRLHTVCESARCPNIHDCFGRGAATFMILGNVCTRRCGFCAVPQGMPGSLDPKEPSQVADMAARMNLRYVVVTSVNRDDLPDGGSRHFAETVRHVRRRLPHARVEVLTPDFRGDLDAVSRVLDAGPDVFNHNMETVRRLYRRVGLHQSPPPLHQPRTMLEQKRLWGEGKTIERRVSLSRLSQRRGSPQCRVAIRGDIDPRRGASSQLAASRLFSTPGEPWSLPGFALSLTFQAQLLAVAQPCVCQPLFDVAGWLNLVVSG